jgi:DNA-binding transcriptional LysR family regulator
MDLRDINYFTVLAEHSHLGRAADALGISQPALSKSLRRLESALAVKLVKRTPKGVELTAEGSALRRRASELRLSLQSVTREIKEVSEGRVGHLHVGIGAAISEEFLSSAFARLLKEAPRTMLNIRVSDNDVMVPAMKNGELDMIVNYRWKQPDETLYEHLYDDDYVVCAAAHHRLAGRKQIKLRDLVDERWALSEPVLHSQQRLHAVFRDAGLPPPNVGLECRSTAIRLRAVAKSDLLDFTSRSVVRQFGGPAVRILAVSELAWRRSVGLLRRKETYLPPVAGRFIDILRSMAKDQAAPVNAS